MGTGAAAEVISDERDRSKTVPASGSILAGETTAVAAVARVLEGAAKEFERNMEASCLLTSSVSEKKCVQVAIVFDLFWIFGIKCQAPRSVEWLSNFGVTPGKKRTGDFVPRWKIDTHVKRFRNFVCK